MKKNQIIVAIIGGIGDQIFQISFADFLKKKLNCNVLLDLSYYKNEKNYNKYKFRLKNLAIKKKYKLIKDGSLINFKYFQYLRFIERFGLNKLVSYIYNFFFKISFSNFIYDFHNSEYQKIKIKKDSYYFGYWHDFKYVKSLKKDLNKFIIYPKLMRNKINKIRKKIKNNTVAIHIRGGDYAFSSGHYILDSNYYNKAINFYIKKLNRPTFHLYTNDISLSKKILSEINCTNKIIFISKTNLTDIEEFSLFTNYKYAIIGNSTFSLMSSFLSNKRNLSIGPYKWFKNQRLQSNKRFSNLKFI